MPQTTNQIYTGRDDHEVVYPAKKNKPPSQSLDTSYLRDLPSTIGERRAK